MGIYVYNSPLVLPKAGGSTGITLSIDGNAHRGGKKVVQWSNIRSTGSWLTFIYEEGDADTDTSWYYYFSATATKTNHINERYALCYADYVLEDGTTGTASVTVYQEGDGGITTSSINPIIFEGDISHITLSPDITYKNGTKDIINTPTVYGDFTCYATYGYADGSNYVVEYDIDATKYNVTAYDKTGSVTFSYANPNSSVENRYELHIRHKACENPFGIVPQGYEIVEEKYFANVTRRIRNIPFTANTFNFYCNYPYQKTSPTIRIDDTSFAALRTTGGGMIDEMGVTEGYAIDFTENFTTGVRSTKLTVEYQTLDGEIHTDYVQLIQNASDGSNIQPEVTAGVLTQKFKYDGTPEMYGYARIRYVGNLVPQTPYVNVDWIEVGEPVLVESVGSYNKLYEYPLTVHMNESTEVRTTEVRYWAKLATNTSKTYGVDVEYIQARYPQKEPIITPEIPVEGGDYIGQIWKDVEYDFGFTDMVEYAIYKDDKPIFISRANKRPFAQNNKILVNKICQNYMELSYLNEGGVAQGGNYQTFKLCSPNGNVVYKTYRFVNDWSYSDDFRTGVLSHPILNDYKSVYYGQLLPFSIFGAAERIGVEYGIRYKDGVVDDYGKPIEDWITTEYVKDNITNINFPFEGRNNDVKGYMIDGVEYNVVDDCNVEYVLYYINPWGGYDWFPIKGKVVEKDSLTQFTYTQNCINTRLDFQKNRYLVEIHKKFTLNTHWLREDESKRMWYLLQSNLVYLHNIKENKIYPVLITNTEIEHKQRSKTSNRISYQIEVELSQTRERL